MAIVNDLTPGNNVLPMDFEVYGSRTQNGSYANGPIKNMRKKEIGVLFLLDVPAVSTNLLLKLRTGDVPGTLSDITDAGLTMVALPGPGMFGAKGTVASAAGVFTITVAGKFALFVPGKLYKQFLTWARQTTGGAAAWSISAIATGPDLPIAS